MKISWLHWKSSSSNRLVDRTYSIAALITPVSGFASNKLLTKRRVFMKTGSGDLGNCYQYFLWSSEVYVFQ